MDIDYVIYISVALIIFIVLILFICFPKPIVYFKDLVTLPYDTNIRNEVIEYLKEHQNKKIIPFHNEDKLPLLMKMLQPIKNNICQMGLIMLPKQFCQEEQTSILCNGMIRCLLCIDYSTYLRTGVSVEKQRAYFNRGEWIFYDASRNNYLFNFDNYEDTILFWMDIPRNPAIPTGIGMVESDELCKSWLCYNNKN